ncbi:MAG: ATP-binding protein [Candidatus Altiarchaeia archaeon]
MELVDYLVRQNPWWSGSKAFQSPPKERRLLEVVLRYQEDKQILCITGLRRVGKTVLMHQFIDRLLEKTNPLRIMYFSFDEIFAKDPDAVEKLIQAYEESILREDLRNVYIFLDEISHVRDWQIILKRYYDLDKGIKFVVSGSAGVNIRKAQESLAGRIYDFQLKPLNYQEYLYFKGIEIKDTVIQKDILKKELVNYLIRGGFPEIINEADYDKVRKYVRSITEKIIYGDIPKTYDAAEPDVLAEIFRQIAKNPGMMIEYRNLASNLGVTYQTASKYVKYLEKAFLIKLLYNHTGSAAAGTRKAKKAYLTTTTLAASALENETDYQGIYTKLAENAVAERSGAENFWRKHGEIDFITKDKTPIEVKYSENPQSDITKNVQAAKTLDAKNLLVVTKDLEKKETRDGLEIEYVPLWKYMM